MSQSQGTFLFKKIVNRTIYPVHFLDYGGKRGLFARESFIRIGSTP